MAKDKNVMRLDKFVAKASGLSRSEATRALKKGFIKLNGQAVSNGKLSMHALDDKVLLDDEQLLFRENVYLMLNKPQGYICATHDEYQSTVLELLPQVFAGREPFCCGRLDIDTTGLVLLTDDGNWAHGITSPKKKCEKIYLVDAETELSEADMAQLEKGVLLDGEERLTAPAKIRDLGEKLYELKITEGKFHQVKRMFIAVGSKVVKLHRQNIGLIELDSNMGLGDWRELSSEEVERLRK